MAEGQAYHKFTSDDQLLTNKSSRREYHRRTDEDKIAVHWGQRKLLLSEIQFITLYWDNLDVPIPILVYAGAAPGLHIPFLSQMFPEAEFHLYDPAPFRIKETDKIKLYQQFFTDDDALNWANRDDVLFVSDIRTADYRTSEQEYGKTEGEKKNEVDIWLDNIRQMGWVNIMKPLRSSLKFRLPYADRWEAMIAENSHWMTDNNIVGGPSMDIVNYLAGEVFLQVWPPQTTTETRLVTYHLLDDGTYPMASYDIKQYEDAMFYHNTVNREVTKYLNPVNETPTPIAGSELLNDYDSVAEAFIIMEYYRKRGGLKMKITQEMVAGMSNAITSLLNSHIPDNERKWSLKQLREAPIKSTSKSAWRAHTKMMTEKRKRKTRTDGGNVKGFGRRKKTTPTKEKKEDKPHTSPVKVVTPKLKPIGKPDGPIKIEPVKVEESQQVTQPKEVVQVEEVSRQIVPKVRTPTAPPTVNRRVPPTVTRKVTPPKSDAPKVTPVTTLAPRKSTTKIRPSTKLPIVGGVARPVVKPPTTGGTRPAVVRPKVNVPIIRR